MSNKQPLSETTAWKALEHHQEHIKDQHLLDLFSEDPKRFDRLHVKLDGLVFDYSKHRITDTTLSLLLDLAQQQGLEQKRQDMVSGVAINTTEKRSVLHTALRGDCPADLTVSGENVSDFVQALRAQIKDIATQIRSNDLITDVIHIGVGGSDLGPRLVCSSLKAMHDGPNVHFLPNIDGQSVQNLLNTLTPQNTVVLIASKTFTTTETMTNALHVKEWLFKAGNLSHHMYGMSAAIEEALSFGILKDHILPMRDWIGGRFSVWSSIGLPVAIALGFDKFMAFLDGAASIDRHFKTAPLNQNIPVLMGLIGIWYRNFCGFSSHAVLPYADSLSLLPIYMQQLDMESNGKASDHKTSPVVFGTPGTGAQHAFMQSLHQGTDIVPCDFIIAANNPYSTKHFQKALVANALAQSQALMNGRKNTEEPHRNFDGNRPSSSLIIPELNPRTMGMLIALYEHKIFVQGTLWDINSFDQWGVELGKFLAKDIIGDLHAGQASSSHDGSTAGLIRVILEG